METVLEDVTGFHVDLRPGAHLGRAVDQAAALSGATIREHARKFSRERFTREIKEWIGADETSGKLSVFPPELQQLKD